MSFVFIYDRFLIYLEYYRFNHIFIHVIIITHLFIKKYSVFSQ